jgi:beta-lactamase class D
MSFSSFYQPIGVALAALLLTQPVLGDGLPRPPEDYFGDFGYCALILSRNRYDEVLIEAGPAQCQQALSPCSTFKIPNALIGLQTGVVSGPGDLKKWDGKERSRAANNRDHTLQSAIKESIVWYFQALARDVGEDRMADWLQKLDYGNQDISGGVDRFWLASSLRIDAYQQMEMIKSLWHGTLPFDPSNQQFLRDMLVQDSDLNGVLHGKTGSCPGVPDHGWFIGWVDWSNPARSDPSTTFFVINTTGTHAWGSEARKIALRILNDLQSGSPAP